MRPRAAGKVGEGGCGIVPPIEYGQITGERTDDVLFTWN